MEDGRTMRDEWKLHMIAAAKGIELFLILGHFLADLFEILPVHRSSFFYFITHNKGFISTSRKTNTGHSVDWKGLTKKHKLVNNRFVKYGQENTLILTYIELLL